MGKPSRGVVVFGVTLLYSLAVTVALRHFFGQTPPAGFADLFLLGVILVSYHCSWKLSAALVAASAGLSTYLLIPLDWTDGYQLVSYAVSASVVVWIMVLLKRRVRQEP